MDVFFELPRGRPFSIEVGFFDTVLEIKEKVQKYQGIPISKQTLILKGQVLQDDGDVWKYEILQNSRIQLVVTPDSDKPALMVKNEEFSSSPPTKIHDHESDNSTTSAATVANTGPGGSKKLKVWAKSGTKKIPVEVNASDNVAELRKELNKLQQRLQFHLPQEGYFFIYEQNVMNDDRSFRWHHVKQGDTIEIFNGSVTGGS
ncbi:ubiquitin domain-containing protein 7SL RNA1-like [Lotus japonicus]|uniref:ubiquitin domain-containing protein 7SL RNA1-like n=1 Tax=Lotus japonicus TaxID=34305 RepID=UPI002582DB4F|nr:ubiquitin domain-containing protein 7SL RNA1-like [Lotus japonicus]